MSKYTTELRFICETEAGYLESQGYNKVNEIVHAARSKIFSFDYPLFDDSYRADLETKILKHYYTREIAAETYGRWKLFLESRMIEIMPYYNELYKSTLIDYDIFEDVNYLRSGNRNVDEDGTHTDNSTSNTETKDTSNTTSNSADTSSTKSLTDTDTSTQNNGSVESTKQYESETHDSGSVNTHRIVDTDTTDTGLAWDKYSDTPQGSVQNIDNDSYLTNARKNTINNSGTVDTDDETTTADSHLNNVEGSETNTTITADSGTVDNTESFESETENVGSENTTNISAGSQDTVNASTGSHTRDTVEEYSELIKGKMPGKSYMQMIQEFRETFLNIDKMIIDELSDLFMMVY